MPVVTLTPRRPDESEKEYAARVQRYEQAVEANERHLAEARQAADANVKVLP